jgi:hypothetical protein
LVFILAGFTIKLSSEENRKWLIIEKGVENDNGYKGLVDSLKSKGFEMHWLAENFPAYNDSALVSEPKNYNKLIAQIQHEADTAVVLSYNYASRFKGEKVSMPSTIKWLQVEPGEKQIAILATALKGDSLVARLSNSNLSSTSFEYKRLPNSEFEKIAKVESLRINPADTINIVIFSETEFDYDRKVVQAAIQAIAIGLPQKLNISILTQSSDIPDNSDIVFWLSKESCQLKEPTVIGYVNCSNLNLPLLISVDKSKPYCDTAESFEFIISKRLNEENALEESFSFSLAKILLNDLTIYKNENPTIDQRSVPTEAAFTDQSRTVDGLSYLNESRAEGEPPLLIFLFLVLIAERYVAYKRNQ